MEQVTLPGTDLNAVVYRPAEGIARAVILSHPGGRLRPRDYDWLNVGLAEAGFLVVGLYQRGYGSGTPGDGDFAGPKQQADALAAVEGLMVATVVDDRPIGMVGHSMGAVLTLLTAARSPRLRSIVALSALVDMARHVHMLREFLPDTYKRYQCLVGGAPEDLPDGYRVRSPIEQATSIRAPTYLLVGENDRVCPPYHSMWMAEALRGNGTRVEIEVLRDAGHFFEPFNFGQPHTEEVTRRVVNWFADTLR